jgi:chromosome partitioning protein
MQTILVINSKGGSGKTTVATNLASYYAGKQYQTALMDYDPQGSSLHWLKQRPNTLGRIQGANAARNIKGQIRSLNMKIHSKTQKLIIDAPAGVKGLLLQDLVRRADSIVVPVAPSAIDIHATADFIKDLHLVGKVRSYNKKVAVIANRVRSSIPLYRPLEKFLISLNIPFVTTLTDSDCYIIAAESGRGVYDMDHKEVMLERAELQPLVKWLENLIVIPHTTSRRNVATFNKRLASRI